MKKVCNFQIAKVQPQRVAYWEIREIYSRGKLIGFHCNWFNVSRYIWESCETLPLFTCTHLRDSIKKSLNVWVEVNLVEF